MNTDRIITLLRIGQLSLDLRAAEVAADSAKHAYHTAWRLFECDGEPDEYEKFEHRIVQGHPQWDGATAATKTEYDAYQAAKWAAYNLKRRWQNACRSVQ